MKTDTTSKIIIIGGGLGGLELIIDKKFKSSSFFFIEKNYVSNKIIYGWDDKNKEAYNNLNLVENFLIDNGMDKSKFKIYDFDKNELPLFSFDIIISLYSLDYHYDFKFYEKYFKKIFSSSTKIIFDTIRPDYFSTVFKNVKILENNYNTVHKSKRILCSELI